MRLIAVAGSDPGGGAGVQMDAAVAAALGGECTPVVTVDTDQGPEGLRSVTPRIAAEVAQDLAVALDQGQGQVAVKLGALGNLGIVRVVAAALHDHPHIPVVLDPVRRASRGNAEQVLLNDAGWQAVRAWLLPRADLVTPNGDEFGDGKDYAACTAVLVTGGHAKEADHTVIDRLWIPGRPPQDFEHPRIPGAEDFHGTGCALSSAIACHLASGHSTEEAVRLAHQLLERWMRNGWPAVGQ